MLTKECFFYLINQGKKDTQQELDLPLKVQKIILMDQTIKITFINSSLAVNLCIVQGIVYD